MSPGLEVGERLPPAQDDHLMEESIRWPGMPAEKRETPPGQEPADENGDAEESDISFDDDFLEDDL